VYSQLHEGWLAEALACPSPNFNERPAGARVSLLVIHNISLPPGDFGTGCVQALFCNRLDTDQHPYFEQLSGLRVSSHLFIERQGRLVQFVPLDKRAWHAGRSAFGGQPECNDFSIGIELEGCDHIPYTEAQYQRLAEVTRILLDHYPDLNPTRITGHADVAPGRKTDPGPAFDWEHYFSLLARDGDEVRNDTVRNDTISDDTKGTRL